MSKVSVSIVGILVGLVTAASASRSPQPGDSEGEGRPPLLAWRDDEGVVRPVRSRDDWEHRRRQILAAMEEVVGAMPSPASEPPLDWREERVIAHPRFVERRITFRSGRGRVPAALLVPNGIGDDERRPAILALHPTHPIGKDVVLGRSERPNRQYAVELAERGYVVLAPDYASFGDYAHDFSVDGLPSGTLRGIIDHRRAVDGLCELPFVDRDRLGVIGHSLGGHNAMFVAAFDERLRVVVSSCGWTLFSHYYGGDIRGWTSDRYMPRLRTAYDLDPRRVPFEFDEVVAALAPRPFFSASPIGDDNFDVEGVRLGVERARAVYELLGAGDSLQTVHPDVGHDFPPATREESYRVIDAALGGRPPAARLEESPQRRAGWAEVDITPPAGYRMSGYFSERLNSGVEDPLRARAIVFREGETAVAIVVCDLIGVPREVSTVARRRVAERTGIPEENVAIVATHSHTGPLYFGVLRDLFRTRAIEAEGRDPHEAVDYAELLVDRIVDVSRRASSLAESVELRVASAERRGLSFNRRFRMVDGAVRFNPGKLNPSILEAAGPEDPRCAVLAAWPPGATTPALVWTVFAMHLDTVGGARYSADFPFHLGRALDARVGGRVLSVFAPAPCGDLNHIDVSSERPQKGPEEARRIGEALGLVVSGALESARPAEGRLAVASRRIRVPLQVYDPSSVEWARRAIERVGAGTMPFLRQVQAYKILDLARRRSTELELEVQAIQLGDEDVWVLLPGEVFVELGLEIRRRSPFARTVVVELANDAPGYLPTRGAFGEGSYETINSRIAPGGGEALVEAAVDALEELRPSAGARGR